MPGSVSRRNRLAFTRRQLVRYPIDGKATAEYPVHALSGQIGLRGHPSKGLGGAKNTIGQNSLVKLGQNILN